MQNILDLIEAIKSVRLLPCEYQGDYEIHGGVTGDSFNFGHIHGGIITLNRSIRSESPEIARQYNTLRHALAKKQIRFEEDNLGS